MKIRKVGIKDSTNLLKHTKICRVQMATVWNNMAKKMLAGHKIPPSVRLQLLVKTRDRSFRNHQNTHQKILQKLTSYLAQSLNQSVGL